MTTELTINTDLQKQVAAIPDELKKEMEERVVIEKPQWRSISRMNDMFNLSDAGPNDKPLSLLNVIILAYAYKNEYYETEWSMSGNNEPPSCWAIDSDKKNLSATTSEKAKDPKVEEGGLCSTCEHDVWGTGRGGKGKRCTNAIQLAVIPMNFEEGDVPYSFKIIRSSIAPFEKHMRTLRENGIHYLQTQTQFSFQGKTVLTNIHPVVPALSKDLMADLMPLREKAIEIISQDPYIPSDELPF